jgi:GTP cyclohydrolase II
MKELAKTRIPTDNGEFEMYAYQAEHVASPHLALIAKGTDTSNTVNVRIHSECMTGDVFGSTRCECGEQLKASMEYVSQNGGVIIYLRQEGRGIGLINKMKAYNLQDEGYDTVEANLKLGFHQDLRDYSVAAYILEDLEIININLLTNNPDKIKSFEKSNIRVEKRIPLEISPRPENQGYLQTKKDSMGHMLNLQNSEVTDENKGI